MSHGSTLFSQENLCASESFNGYSCGCTHPIDGNSDRFINSLTGRHGKLWRGNPFFCLIAEACFSGLTSGTSATTYSPADNVTREQMVAFITRTMDQSLKRRSRRAVAKRRSRHDRAEGLKSPMLRSPATFKWGSFSVQL
jgi:hypothetical protein